MRNFALKDICDCTAYQQDCVLQIRNSETVRREMYTDHIIEAEEHAKYIRALRTDKRQTLFAVLAEGESVVGAVSVSQIDMKNKKCEWAFYIDGSIRGGVGSALEVFVLNYVFNKLGVEKLNCEVIETNPVVVKMHKKFGFVEEGFRRSNLIKNDKRVGVHFLGITREGWLIKRPEVMERVGERLSEINIYFDQGANASS